jgi:hypothetical protein
MRCVQPVARLRDAWRRESTRELVRAVVVPYVVHRTLLAMAVYFGAELVGVARGWRALPRAPFLDVWIRWDSFYYLVIATHGYGVNPWGTPNPFFPLYAWLIQIFGFVMPLPIAALVVANLAAIVALALLYVYVKKTSGAVLASRVVQIVLVFPTSFFLSAAYSESTYLALAIAVVLFWSNRQQARAGIAAILGSLTRPVGVVSLGVPFVIGWLVRSRRLRDFPWFAFGTIIGAGLVLLTYKLSTGDAFAFMHSPQVEALGRFARAEQSPAFLAVLWDEGWSRNLMRRFLNWSAILLVSVASLHFLRRKELELALLTLLAVAVPLYFQRTLLDAASMARYALCAFPIFIALARWAPDGLRARALDSGFQMIQIVLAVMFAAIEWAE